MPSVPIDVTAICQDVFKVTPNQDQLEVVKLIAEGRDCILIAGCGWGKSLVYFLPLVLWKDRAVVIVSPLKALMEEQSQKLVALGIPTFNTSQESAQGTNLLDELANGNHSAIFMTPELIIDSMKIKELWNNPTWRGKLLSIVFDEAHCVQEWGEAFRTAYSELKWLRYTTDTHVSFVALSATLPPTTLAFVKKSLGFRPDVTVINKGNDRPNIRLEMRAVGNGYDGLNFVLDGLKTIVYFEARKEVQGAYHHLESLAQRVSDNTNGLERPLTKIISYPYYALYSEDYKKDTMERYRKGDFTVLLSTEAAGMGCDIRDVIRVVQFKNPSSINSLVQRLGRAARDPNLQGYGILLTSGRQAVHDENITQYLKTETCRRRVLDDIFGNQPSDNQNCCDICHPDKWLKIPPSLQEIIDEINFPLSRRTRTRITPEGRERAKELMDTWRNGIMKDEYSGIQSFIDITSSCILPDEYLKSLAGCYNRIVSPGMLSVILPNWSPIRPEYLEQLESLLIGLNKELHPKIYDTCSLEPEQQLMELPEVLAYEEPQGIPGQPDPELSQPQTPDIQQMLQSWVGSPEPCTWNSPQSPRLPESPQTPNTPKASQTPRIPVTPRTPHILRASQLPYTPTTSHTSPTSAPRSPLQKAHRQRKYDVFLQSISHEKMRQPVFTMEKDQLTEASFEVSNEHQAAPPATNRVRHPNSNPFLNTGPEDFEPAVNRTRSQLLGTRKTKSCHQIQDIGTVGLARSVQYTTKTGDNIAGSSSSGSKNGIYRAPGAPLTPKNSKSPRRPSSSPFVQVVFPQSTKSRKSKVD